MTIVRDINTDTVWIKEGDVFRCAICDGNQCVCCCCYGLKLYSNINISYGEYDFCPNCYYLNEPDLLFKEILNEEYLDLVFYPNIFHTDIENISPRIV